MKRKVNISLLIMVTIAVIFGGCAMDKAHQKPNVLFIAVDDMNDWVGFLDGYPGIQTPNLDKLAEQGVAFANAHSPSPMCGPSRAAIMSGKYPHKTGIYTNGQWWRPNYPDMVTIPMHFKSNGYYVAGTGKIFHHTAGFNPPDQWHEFQRMEYDDPWDRVSRLNYPWSKVEEVPEWHPLNALKTDHEFDWGILPNKAENDYGDAKSVNWCIDFLQQEKTENPFFLACGLFHPHMPWYAPQKYFDMYPLDKIVLPDTLKDDLSDIPPIGSKLASERRNHFLRIKHAGKWKEAVQAYLASISFADAQVGRLLDALEKTENSENTIIVFWSDHGWHLGEKETWHKGTLWQRATRVPFIIVDPRKESKGVCKTPVNLIDIYKTLNELCDLPEVENIDGQSLVPQLQNVNEERTYPSLISFQEGNFALQGNGFHYIRYKDGTEELYNHSNDINEWYNIADSNNIKVLSYFRESIPKDINKGILEKNAFQFDYKQYTWKKK